MLRIFRHYCSAPALFLCVCETIAVALALYFAASILLPADAASGRLVVAALVPALVNAVLMFGMGLYDPPHVANFRRALPRLVACLCIGAPLLGRTLSIDGTGEARTVYYLAWTVLVIACIVAGAHGGDAAGAHRLPAAPRSRGRRRAPCRRDRAADGAAPHSRTEVVGYVALGDETRRGAGRAPQVRRCAAHRRGARQRRQGNRGRRSTIAAACRSQPLLDARMEGDHRHALSRASGSARRAASICARSIRAGSSIATGSTSAPRPTRS